MFKNADEIKAAVDNGKTVYWAHTNYVVRKDKFGEYNIVCLMNNNVIGLTWTDGKTLNGEIWDFFTNDDFPNGSQQLNEKQMEMMEDEIRFLRNKLQKVTGIQTSDCLHYPRRYLEAK